MSHRPSQSRDMTDDEIWEWLQQEPASWNSILTWPGDLGSPLLYWTLARRFPIHRSIDRELQRLVQATRTLEPVTFRYFGGSDPGQDRSIHPTVVFEVAGFPGIFVSGWCRRTRWIRTFRFDRMRLQARPTDESRQ